MSYNVMYFINTVKKNESRSDENVISFVKAVAN